MKTPNSPPFYKPNVNQFDANSFLIDLEHKLRTNYGWDATDTNYKFNIFLDTFLYAVNNHAPVVKMSSKLALKPWLTKGIIVSIKHKNRMYKIVLKSRYDFHLNKCFKNFSKILTQLKKKSKIIYYQKEFEQSIFNPNKA